MSSTREKEERRQKQTKVSDHVIATLPSMDQINKDKKQQQHKNTSPLLEAAATATPQQQQQPVEAEGVVQMGGGLPALPPKPPVPQRQAQATVSSAFSNGRMAQRVPNVKQASVPQLNIPAGSDLGAVGKIGAYQMAQIKPKNTSSATEIHPNMFFWVYALFFVVILVMKKQ